MIEIEASYFMGKRIGDMTREELVDALSLVLHSAEVEREAHRSTLNAWSAFQQAR